MSDKSLIPASAQPLIPVAATVQMDDVVSIRVASVERSLNELFESKKLVLEDLRKNLEKTQKTLHKVLESEGKVLPQEVKDAVTALKKAGCKDAKANIGSVSISGGKIVQPISVSNENSYHTVNWNCHVQPSAELKALNDEVNDLSKQVKTVSEEMSKLVQARGRLGSVERTARAAVAQTRLSQTAEGKKIIAELKAHDPSLMLGLPPGTIQAD